MLITIEEGSVGGFASHVLQHLATAGLLDHGLKVRPMILPDRFIDHASPAKQYEQAGLDAPGIVGDRARRARPAGRARARLKQKARQRRAFRSNLLEAYFGCGTMRR